MLLFTVFLCHFYSLLFSLSRLSVQKREGSTSNMVVWLAFVDRRILRLVVFSNAMLLRFEDPNATNIDSRTNS